jgi:alkylation response protein AidB-like acyl-CoA dehydrogenase
MPYAAPPIVGEGYRLTPQQGELLELASRLGRTLRGARLVTTAMRPSLRKLRGHARRSLLKLCVPESYGGAGADLLTYCIVAAEIGRHCGSTALTYNMHVCSPCGPAGWPTIST